MSNHRRFLVVMTVALTALVAVVASTSNVYTNMTPDEKQQFWNRFIQAAGTAR